MNNRYQRMNDFLTYFQKIAKENPTYDLSFNAVYSKLTGFGVTEGKKKIHGNFPIWIDYYENDPRSKVYVREPYNYFCHFVSSDLKAMAASENLKVYIPLDSQHIKEGAIQIFNFLSKEGISHASKIGSNLRVDDIVIRLINPNDFFKLMEFVKNNQYLQEGLIPANPFPFNFNGLALAVDGNISYNSTVAMLVKLYITDCSKNNNLDNVSLSDFIKYVTNYYNKNFSSYEGLNRVSKDFRELEDEDLTPEILLNYKNVIELFIKSMNKDFSLSDYLNHYEKCRNGSRQLKEEEKLVEIMNTPNEETDEAKKARYSIIEKRVILAINEILTTMGDKYGKAVATSNLIQYVITGKDDLLTRSQGLRNRIHNSSFREDIINILNERKIDITNYLNIVSSVTIQQSGVYLEQAIMETYKIFEDLYQKGQFNYDGKKYITMALKQLIESGIYYGFTRNNDARKNLEDNVSVYEVKRIIAEELGLDYALIHDGIIKKYVEIVINNNKNKSL